MCAVAVIVLLARWEAWRREERARREDYSVNGWLDGAEQSESADVEGHYHDVERSGRAYVTVDAIKTRITREAAETPRQHAISENTSPLPRVRPSPSPRGGRRAAEQ